jgi:hypothetical protein
MISSNEEEDDVAKKENNISTLLPTLEDEITNAYLSIENTLMCNPKM